MKGNTTPIRVAVRIRPLNSRERLNESAECLDVAERASIEDHPRVAIGAHIFCFDEIHTQSGTQEEVFERNILEVVESIVGGYNSTVIAYGQTGSGKTHTMGTGFGGQEDPQARGILPRTVQLIFERMQDMQQNQDEDMKLEKYMSFIELYNEDIIDLLTPADIGERRSGFAIREDRRGDIQIPGVTEEKITAPEHLLELLQKGALCRTTGSTEMNATSSRSHAICTITLRFTVATQEEGGGTQAKRLMSKLHFVDLAGSERMKKTMAVGKRAKESISINTGLLALGNVISALGDETRRVAHIPYRDSKLTRLLQDSLGGNSRTVIIACVSPATENFSETLNTLQYANRARNIRNRATVNQEAGGSQHFEVLQLRKQVSALKKEIISLRGNISMANTPKHAHKGPYRPARLPGTPKSGVSPRRPDSFTAERKKETIRRARESSREVSACLQKHGLDSEEIFEVFRTDEAIREDLYKALEDAIKETEGVREKYAEKMEQLEQKVAAADRERDRALSRVKKPATPDALLRRRYEDKIQQLGREINKLEAQKTQRNPPKPKEDTEQKWRRGFEYQQKVMQKKEEQFTVAKEKIKSLLSLLQKRRIALNSPPSSPLDLSSPSWKVLQITPEKENNPPEKKMKRLSIGGGEKEGNTRLQMKPLRALPRMLRPTPSSPLKEKHKEDTDRDKPK
ncbi:MAG: kinesin-like protein [Amphiamblys sp. WSBS2006]|nr:MAG: kinesin-like protein [Amphiamblys sp. WSBS2006]